MPRFPDPRAARRRRATPGRPPRVVVLGDLVLDVVLAPARPLERGTDVPGRVMLRQGGSAATTARWLGRLHAPVTFVCAVGRDGPGRALVAALEGDGVLVEAMRVAGIRTGRIGVLVDPGGERSFVADRGAADRLRPGDLRPAWFAGAAALHLPAYSLLTRPLGEAALAAIEIARGAGARVTLDLASIGPLLEGGRRAAAELVARVAPDVLFATSSEASALLGVGRQEGGLLALAPIAIVKRGAQGATILARDGRAALRFEVATTPLVVADTTGAGDAFDAGFLAAWLEARARGVAPAAALQRAALAGNRVAARHLGTPPGELAFAG